MFFVVVVVAITAIVTYILPVVATVIVVHAQSINLASFSVASISIVVTFDSIVSLSASDVVILVAPAFVHAS